MINVLRNSKHLNFGIASTEPNVVKQPKPETINSKPEFTKPLNAPKKNSIDIEALFQNRMTRQLQTTRI